MKKEAIAILAQLLTAIKDGIRKLEDAQKNKDAEEIALARREILSFQRQISEII